MVNEWSFLGEKSCVDDWTVGDGVSERKQLVGILGSCECVARCRAMAGANGVTMSNNGKDVGTCYCQFGMTSSNVALMWKSVYLDDVSEI